MKAWLPHPVLTLVLAILWLLLNDSVAPGQIVLGLVLGWGIPRLTVGFWPGRVRVRAPVCMLRFAGVFLCDMIAANLSVAWLILAGPTRLRPAFVLVPLDLRDEIAISLLANTICLVPGTVSARLSADHRQLLVHALDCDDPDRLAATIKLRYEAPLKAIFEGGGAC